MYIYIILLRTVDQKAKMPSACFILENLQDYSSTQLERRRANHQQCWQNPEDLTQVEVERKASIKRYLVNKFMFSS